MVMELNRVGPGGTRRDGMVWDSVGWGATRWDGVGWGGVGWDGRAGGAREG